MYPCRHGCATAKLQYLGTAPLRRTAKLSIRLNSKFKRLSTELMALAPFPFLLKAFIKTLKSPSVLPFALYLSVSFANQLIEIPLLRLLENAICSRHYRSTRDDSPSIFIGIDEILCKIPAVQDQLSDVVGWKICFDAIPGIRIFMFGGMITV